MSNVDYVEMVLLTGAHDSSEFSFPMTPAYIATMNLQNVEFTCGRRLTPAPAHNSRNKLLRYMLTMTFASFRSGEYVERFESMNRRSCRAKDGRIYIRQPMVLRSYTNSWPKPSGQLLPALS